MGTVPPELCKIYTVCPGIPVYALAPELDLAHSREAKVRYLPRKGGKRFKYIGGLSEPDLLFRGDEASKEIKQ